MTLVAVNLLLLVMIEGASVLIQHAKFTKSAYLGERKRSVEQPYDPLLGWGMAPSASIEDSHTRIQTDEEGRSIVPDALPNPDLIVVVTGGSTMFGVGVTNNAQTVPSQIQTRLREDHGLRVNVVNLGVRGYNSYQEMAALDAYLAAHRVDATLAISGHNDSVTLLSGASRENMIGRMDPAHTLVMRRLEAGRLVVANVGSQLEQWSATAAVLNNLAQQVHRRPAPVVTSTLAPEDATERLDISLGHYAMMDAATRMHHALFRMYLQPTAATKAMLSPKETKTLKRQYDERSPEAAAAVQARPHRFYAMFAAAEKPFPWVDFSGAMGSESDTCYVDNCHYRPLGASLLGRAVADDIAPLLNARLAARPTAPALSATVRSR